MAINTLSLMDKIVTANCLRLRIGEESEGVAGLRDHALVDFGCVNTNCYRTNPYLMKTRQTFFNAP